MTEADYQRLLLVLGQFDFDENAGNPKRTTLIGHRKTIELESRVKALEEKGSADK